MTFSERNFLPMSMFTKILFGTTVVALLLFFFLSTYREYRFLLPKYTETKGVVLDTHVVWSPKYPVHYLIIQFTTDKNKIETFVDKQLPWSNREKGSSIKIVYDKNNPRDASIKFSWVIILGMHLLTLVIISPVFYWLRRKFKVKE